jgi:hypothetical protein
MEYEQVRSTRQCATTGRQFAPGETIYSVLTAEGSNLVRQDYSAEAWNGPPENAVGWWKSQAPGREVKRVRWAPNDVMLDLLEQLEGNAEQADMRYVLALLLVRRRMCRLEEGGKTNSAELLLSCSRREREYRVQVATPDAQRTKEIQNELARLLFAA